MHFVESSNEKNKNSEKENKTHNGLDFVRSWECSIVYLVSAYCPVYCLKAPHLEFNPVGDGIQGHYSIYFPFYALDLFRIRFFIFRELSIERHFGGKKQQPKTRTNKMNYDYGGVYALGDIILDICPRANAIIMIIEWPSKSLLVPTTFYDQIQSSSVSFWCVCQQDPFFQRIFDFMRTNTQKEECIHWWASSGLNRRIFLPIERMD